MLKIFLNWMFSLSLLLSSMLRADELLANSFPSNRIYISPTWFVNDKTEEGPFGFRMSSTNIFREECGYQYSKRNSVYFYARESWGGGPGLHTLGNVKEIIFSYPWYFESRIGYQLSLDKTMNLALTPYLGYFLLGQLTYLNSLPGLFQKALLQNVVAGAMLDYIINKNFRVSILFNFLFGVSGEAKTGARYVDTTVINLQNKVNYLSEIWITWQITNYLDLTLVPSYVWENGATGYGPSAVFQTERNPGLRLELGYRI